MKATATHKLVRLAAVAAPAVTLAATAGFYGWSDETLKRDVHTIEGSLARIATI